MSQRRSSSKCKPSNVTVDFTCIMQPLMCNLKLECGSVCDCFLKHMAVVLLVFRDNLLHENQSNKAFRLEFINWHIVCMLVPEIYTGVSSANCIMLEFDTQYGRSLVYKEKSTGPKIDPCGTPWSIFDIEEELL